MSDDEWAEWVVSHATMFGMRSADDDAMVNAWRPALNQYTPNELEAASVALLKDGPRFRDQHVAGLLRYLAMKRAQQAQAIAAQSDNGFTLAKCSVCQGGGYAIVPHPNCMKDGEFVAGPGGYKTTVAVTCSCGIGFRKMQSFDAVEKKPMTLADYEAKHGRGWPSLMDDWRDEKSRHYEMLRFARGNDKKLGPMVAREIAKRMKP